MKKYIIVTYEVSNMGGGQLYVLRRCNHLKELNYDVAIVVYHEGEYFPLRAHFESVPIIFIPEVGDASAKVSTKRKKEILSYIKSLVSDCQDIYIESHTLYCAEWGELFAATCHARHLAYPLAEPLFSNVRFSPAKEIIERKLSNNEFYGCTSTSLRNIFKREVSPNNYVNIGFDTSELVNNCIPVIHNYKNKDNYVITTIGRLEKGYIEPLIKAVIRFANKRSKQKIVLIIAGGSSSTDWEKYLKETYSDKVLSFPNLRIVFLGYIEKLGKDLFKMTDLFVGMGTASINSISQGCITLNIDPLSNKTSGFFGVDTRNFAYSESGMVWDIDEKIDEAYLLSDEEKDIVSSLGKKLFGEEYENKSCMAKIDRVIGLSPRVTQGMLPRVSSFYFFYVRMGVFLKRRLFR